VAGRPWIDAFTASRRPRHWTVWPASLRRGPGRLVAQHRTGGRRPARCRLSEYEPGASGERLCHDISPVNPTMRHQDGRVCLPRPPQAMDVTADHRSRPDPNGNGGDQGRPYALLFGLRIANSSRLRTRSWTLDWLVGVDLRVCLPGARNLRTNPGVLSGRGRKFVEPATAQGAVGGGAVFWVRQEIRRRRKIGMPQTGLAARPAQSEARLAFACGEPRAPQARPPGPISRSCSPICTVSTPSSTKNNSSSLA
jgi:hypothetical protein